MSTVRANTYLDASGGSNAQLFGVASPPNSMGFRNRIINGDMRIDQRNAGASVTYTNTVGYGLDRWRNVALGTSLGFSVQRSTVAPAGFTNSLLTTVTSAKSPGSSDQARVNQYLEGFNVADLAWGTSSAVSVTLSFWVRASVTGTYCVALSNADSATRSYVAAYTISAANTWEQKTIVVPGDTTGTWLTSNGIGLGVSFSLGCGSSFNAPAASTWYGAEYQQTSSQTSWISTSGATFYITGVQLEAGTVASPFERRDYGRELMMCQRYFQAASNFIYSTSFARICYMFPVQMRTAPTLAGGGSGFSSSNVTVAGYCAEQTSGGTQSMTFSSEL